MVRKTIVLILLFGYGVSAVVPSLVFTKKSGSSFTKNQEIVYELEFFHFLFAASALPSEQENSDSEDDLSTEDEYSHEIPNYSGLSSLDYQYAYLVNCVPISGNSSTPYSPPETGIS